MLSRLKKGLLMVAQKRYMLIVAVLMLAGAGLYARKRCTTPEDCRENENCQCYCSGIAGYRNKVDEDNPVYVESDEYIAKNGEVVHCFCKPWDKTKFPGPAERD